MLMLFGSNINVVLDKQRVLLYDDNRLIKYNGEIEIYGKKYKKDLNWIKYCCIYGIRFNKNETKLIESLEFVRYKSKRKKEKDLLYFPIFKTPIEQKVNGKVYRRVARYPSYLVSKDGDVVSVYFLNRSIVKSYSEHWKYPVIYIYDSFLKEFVTVNMHRLVAMAWVPNNDYYNFNIVDHKDHNKTNYHADNLQWISEGLNQTREFYGDKPAFQIRNIDTGEVIDFRSQQDFFRWNNGKKINFGNNFNLMHYGKWWKLKKGNFEIKPCSDNRDWWYINHNEPPKELSNDFGKNVQVKNISTNEVTEGSVDDIEKKVNLSRSVIYKRLYNNDLNVVCNGYLIRFKTDEPWPSENEIKLPRNTPKPVYVEDTISGEVIKYNSIKEADVATGVSQRSVVKYLDTNKPITRQNNIYKFWSSYSGNRVSEIP